MSEESIRLRLRNDPELSNRAIASKVGTSDKKVGEIRTDMETRGEIPRVTQVRGLDGKLRRIPQKREAAFKEETGTTSEAVLPFTQNRYRGRSRTSISEESVLGQLRLAARSHPLAFLGALPFGGFVPVSVWCLTHLEVLVTWQWAMVAGGALFSGLTVIEWGERILRSLPKAVGFAILVEGLMIASATPWLSLFALAQLILINAVACAVALTADDKFGNNR